MTKDPERERHRVLGSESRVQLLEMLQAVGHSVTVGQAAEAAGLHTNTARFHLDLLVSVGLAERVTERRSLPGRPKVLYQATPVAAASPMGADDYRMLAGVLADGMAATSDPARAAIAAGERWAQAIERRTPQQPDDPATVADELGSLLADLGFEPELDVEHAQIRLHRCPFEEIARDNRTVVCGVHLGMLRASLPRLGAAGVEVDLEPLVSVEPLLCLVHLAATGQDRTIEHASSARAAAEPPRTRAGRRAQ
ncbi:MAG TPA: helix-turn-helix domain-containing protein [Actinomycetes bacterium]